MLLHYTETENEKEKDLGQIRGAERIGLDA